MKTVQDWKNENGYRYKKLEMCLNCVNFSVYFDNPVIGNCLLLEEKLDSPECVIPAAGVCKNYSDTNGIGFNNEVVIPALQQRAS